MPPLLLQPLAENAVKHGVASLVDGGFVRIRASRAGDLLRIVVENDFDPESPPPKRSGLGLPNVRNRIKTRHGERGHMNVTVAGTLHRVELLIPCNTPAPAPGVSHADNQNIRAVIVDDEELARRILREFLAPSSDIEVIAECSNGFDAVKGDFGDASRSDFPRRPDAEVNRLRGVGADRIRSCRHFRHRVRFIRDEGVRRARRRLPAEAL